MQQNNSNKTPFGPERDQDQKPNRKPIIYYYLIVAAFMLVFNWLIVPWMAQRQVVQVTYTQFDQMLKDDQVTAVQIGEGELLFTAKVNGKEGAFKTGQVDDPDLVAHLREKNIEFAAPIPERPNVFLNFLLTWGLPLLLFFWLQRTMTKRLAGGGGMGGLFGQKSVVKKYEPTKDRKTFADVAGVDEAVDSLSEIVGYLKDSSKYAEIGAKLPKGVILVGPPGTGKTLIAKAVAGEANVPFYSASGSEFVEMFVGRGASKVRELFDEAKKNAPCIVFIDEIDTIGKRRDAGGVGGNDEREQTLNQLLTEMDGFDGNSCVVVLAATNRPEILDPALLRPGRFDRRVPVELPDLDGRSKIFQVHAQGYKMEPNIDWKQIARATAGASGAQIANIVNEAALRAVRMNRKTVSQADLQESIETVIAGQQKKGEILSPEEKRIVAFHEVGHALVAALQSGTAPVEKITIIPRTSGALGYTMQVEQDDKYLISRKDALASIRTICGGRAAEEVMFDDFTTGASNDIEKATQMATEMVTKYGMSDRFGMMKLEQGGSQYLGYGATSSVSPVTQEKVDQEVLDIIKNCQQEARELLEKNKPTLERLAEYLLEKETINGKEFMELMEESKV
ncbi:MAG: ATP-dependent zinc metalloprotease FtsH [Clostridiales bacterium]|nr:ATP-dependent zinc metalloprotease FtsH [Clostridiales bacterium]